MGQTVVSAPSQTLISDMLRAFGLALLIYLVILLLLSFGAEAACRGPDISAREAMQMLSMQGVGVGTVRQVGELGRVAVAGLKVGSEGKWVVIKVLPRALDRAMCPLR